MIHQEAGEDRLFRQRIAAVDIEGLSTVEAARELNFNAGSLRTMIPYYVRRGFPEPAKNESGYYRWTQETIAVWVNLLATRRASKDE